MDPTIEAVLLAAGFVAFVLAAFGVGRWNVNWLGVGLACWIFVPLWDALERAF